MNDLVRSCIIGGLLLLAIFAGVKSQQECDFETDFCGWTQSPDSTVDWVRKQGISDNGPIHDHTHYSNTSYYLFFESQYGVDLIIIIINGQVDTSILKSPQINGNNKQCLEFWYYMYGPRAGALSIHTNSIDAQNVETISAKPLWTRSKNQGDHWQHAQVQYDGGDPNIKNLLIKGYADYLSAGDIALDDTKLIEGSCQAPDFFAINCDFESDNLCGYTSDQTVEYRWERFKGPTQTPNTGPSVDATYETEYGHYMYAKASSQKRGDRARLVSAPESSSQAKCVTFMYHAYGADIGSLNVYAEEVLGVPNTPNPKTLLWTVSRSQSNSWYRARVSTEFSNDIRIIFEAIVGKSIAGDIAVDDVFASSIPCPQTAACDFENPEFEFCSWMNFPNRDAGDFDWELISPDASNQFGQLADHTTGTVNGHFALAYNDKAGSQARLISEILPATSDSNGCFSFYYYFHKNVGYMLTISLAEYDMNLVKIWELADTKDVAGTWKQAQVSFKTLDAYKIFIDVTSSGDAKAFIGIDDIKFTFSSATCFTVPGFAIPQDQHTTTAATTRTTRPSIESLDCSFETACGWTNVPSARCNWTVVNAGQANQIYNGPSFDHTKNDPSGSYIIPLAANYSDYFTGSYMSPLLRGSKCLEFWYYMYGADVGSINVAVRTNTTGFIATTTVWSSSSGASDEWKFGRISQSSPNLENTYAYRFDNFYSGTNFDGFVAIDDIIVHEGVCIPEKDFCDFEDEGLCDFQLSGDFGWSKGNGKNLTSFLGTNMTDHTSESEGGNFAFIDVRTPAVNAKARMTSPSYSKTGGSCVTFFFYTNGNEDHILNVFTRIDGAYSSNLFSVSGDVGKEWQHGQINIVSPSSDWQIVFEGIKGTKSTGLIAIDDIKFSKGICPNLGDCSFDDGSTCGYRNVHNSQINWITRRGLAPNSGTGPSNDHTLANYRGYYVLFETGWITQAGAKGRMESEFIPSLKSASCVRFYYHMKASNPQDLGKLNVYKYSYDTMKETLIWRLEFAQGDDWLEAKVSYMESSKHVIIFEGVRGTGTGDIALDDISFYPSSNCTTLPALADPSEPEPTPTTRTTLVSRTRTNPTTYTWQSESQYDCNFEQKNLCSWSNDTTGTQFWQLKSGPAISATASYGPQTDHTYLNATGTYIWIDPRYPSKYNRSRIYSPEIRSGDKCIEFYYHAYGSDVNTLNLYLKQNNELGAPVWQRIRNQGNSWFRGEYRIKGVTNPYQMVFEGVTGGWSTGAIALDDIRFLNNCPAKTGRFCDFESDDICQYTMNDVGGVSWLRGNKIGSQVGPNTDHTTGSSSGYYMYTRGTSTSTEKKGYLITNQIEPNAEQCLEFFYFQDTSSIGDFNIYIKYVTQNITSIGLPLWTEPLVNNNDKNWKIAQVPLSNQITQKAYQILFEHFIPGNNAAKLYNIYLDDVYIRDHSCLPPGDCDFDSGLCTWSIPTVSQVDWQLGNGNSGNVNRPQVDHTTNSDDGSYIFLQASNSIDKGETALLSSESFMNTSPKGRCLTFWYYISGQDAGFIEFSVKDLVTNNVFVLWKDGGFDFGNSWNYGQFGFYLDSTHEVTVKATRGGSAGSVAVDDIIFKESRYCSVFPDEAATGEELPLPATSTATTTKNPVTKPPGAFDCDFEAGFCNWKNDYSQKLNWTRNQGDTDSYDTGPLVDHTTGTQSGWYIYIETSAPAKQNDSARLESPKITDLSTKCLEFYYHMRGRHVDTLNVFAINDSSYEYALWSKSGNQGRNWIRGQTDIQMSEAYRLSFEAIRGLDYEGDIALDDIAMTDGFCERNQVLECTFEQGMCDFKDDPTAKFNWTRRAGKLSFGLTGPSVDHTTSSAKGFYMIIDSSFPRQNGDLARLISPQIPFAPSGYCFSWWYHLFGADMGALSVYLMVEGKLGLYWRMGENLGDIWNYGQFSIPQLANTKNFSVVFEGERGVSTYSNMAIDDIKIEKGECVTFQSCSFEGDDYCTWYNVIDGRDKFDWEFGSKQTSSFDTGPSADHTYNSSLGVYLFIEASYPADVGWTAKLESTIFQRTPSYGVCMELWYHMFGAGTGILNVYANASNISSLLWTQNGNKGDVWLNAQVPIVSASSYRIIIEAVRGLDYSSDIAIDDIDFVEKSCVLLPESANPANKVTIPIKTTTRSLRPTNIDDCNFEKDFCYFKNAAANTFNWTRAQGVQGSQVQGPVPADQTTGTPEGWYIFAPAGSKKPTDVARLEGSAVYSSRCLTFYYILYANTKFQFNIYVQVSNDLGVPLWSRTSSTDSVWRLGRISINSPSFGFKPVFEITGIASGSAQDIFALDDVFFSYGNCSDTSDINSVCTFTNSTCGYSFNSTNPNFQWQLYTPPIPQFSSEPEAARAPSPIGINDHTAQGAGSGFIYAAGGSTPKNQTASFISKTYPPFSTESPGDASRCLEFYFFIQGDDTVSLTVKAFSYVSSFTTTRLTLWSRNYDHSGQWWKAEQNIRLITNYSIAFEALTEGTPNGIVAVDDITLKNGNCSSLSNGIAECTFDKKDFCTWTQPNDTDEFDWRLEYISTLTSMTGPSYDHTLGTYQGYFIYTEASAPTKEGWRAHLNSEPMIDKETKCMHFWYSMYGSGMGTLNVYLKTGTARQLMWSLSGNQGQRWLQGFFPFQSNVTHQIQFEGVRGPTEYSDMALDDVIIRVENCAIQPQSAVPQKQVSADCGFESSFCGWSSDPQNSNFNWTLVSASNSGAKDSDGYAYIDNRNQGPGSKARLMSPQIPRPLPAGYCLEFYYIVFGSDVGGLEVRSIRADKTNQTVVYSINGTRNDRWRQALVRFELLTMDYDFFVAIDGIVGKSQENSSFVAIDEVKVNYGSCPLTTYCDFDLDYCGWKNDTQAEFAWWRHKGSTSTTLTGPSTDHTTNSANGYYIYIETSYPQVQNDKARLISPVYPPTDSEGVCFKFWYHMYGMSQGTINVLLRKGGQYTRPIWSRSGNYGNLWRYGHVTIRSDSDFQIVLEGIVGRSIEGDAAIDDIEVENGACYEEASCDFESGTCGYYNTKEGDDFDWLRSRAMHVNLTYSPSVDVTTGTTEGHFAYIKPTSSERPNQKAWLVSELITNDMEACLTYYYYLHGQTAPAVGNLTIYSRTENKAPVSLASFSGDKGSSWILGELTLPINTLYYDILFEATVGQTNEAIIALDDIKLTKGGTCTFFKSTTTRQTTTTTLPAFKYQCSFELNFCDWMTDSVSTQAQWTRRNGELAVFGEAPFNDVTYQNRLGYYAHVNLKTSQTGVALLKSPSLAKLAQCFEFWYQVGGPVNSGLEVSIRQASNKTTIWKRDGSMSDTWNHAYVNIPEDRTNFARSIEAEVDTSASSDGFVALDDIRVLQGPCPASQYCDFEKDICDYQHDITAKFKWDRNKGKTSSGTLGTGPTTDHTYQTPEGYYLYIEASAPQTLGDKARIISKHYMKKPGGYCLNWWYHAYGATIGSLSVYTRIRNELSAQPIWKIEKNQGNQWRAAAVTIIPDEDFQVVFEGVVGSSYDGDIAIDDIFMDSNGPCAPKGVCTFEDSTCLWTPQQTNSFNFLRISSQQLKTIMPGNLEPEIKADVTTNSKYGHFLWIGPEYFPNMSNKSTTLLSETFFNKDFPVMSCFSFWYFMNGDDVASINVYRKLSSLNNKTVHFTQFGNQGNEWKRALVDLPQVTDNFEIYVEALIGRTKGNLALDDFQMYANDCRSIPPLPTSEKNFSCADGTSIPQTKVCNYVKDCANGIDERDCANCNFEESTCMWRDSSPSAFKWSRAKAGTTNNGPSIDHTTNGASGYFMFLESNLANFDYAFLTLDVFLRPTSPTCKLVFWYHMLGSTDEVHAYLLEEDFGSLLLDLVGDFGDKWNRAEIPVGRVKGNFKLLFNGVRFASNEADVAIDDVSMEDCAFPDPKPNGCPADYFACRDKSCVPKTSVCDLLDHCSDGFDEQNCDSYSQCDFENGLCEWIADESLATKWSLTTGADHMYYRPSRDRTTGLSVGHYLNLKHTEKGDKARIYSLTYKNNGRCTLRLHYHMYGKTVGTLNVFTRNSAHLEKLVYTKSANVGYFWDRAEIAIDEPDWFQVVIEGVVGDKLWDDLSLDDISFTSDCQKNGTYFSTTTNSPPMTNDPTCPAGYCTNGYCYKEGENYLCKCPPDYEGERCEVKIEAEKPKKSHTGLIVGLLVPALVILFAGLGLLYWKKRDTINLKIPFLRKGSFNGGISYSNMPNTNSFEGITINNPNYKS